MTKDQFLQGVQNWDNHRFLLWPALEATTGDVVEMGMGQGSTPFLNQYCADGHRHLFSYDNTLSWVHKFEDYAGKYHRMFHVSDWDRISEIHPSPDVVLIDHAPGERRKIDIPRFANTAKIIVAHDTEYEADHGYQMRQEISKFKYSLEYKSPGAWATAMSNFIDVSKWEI